MREFLNEDSSVVAFKQQRTIYGPASQSKSGRSSLRISRMNV